ncbi:uncharacterized protein LOC105191774 [Harpegnathos saltator]|uniref:uncharacterized protein LOC105191774 n=1 Tax=Harpegnathos saltator TaxID=610380 RepID=UPI00058D9A2C|nr:uncharacterized protein LOC105191774 [Harpegnathos saltator]XP_019700924.1 uncharacterized protein LOC105191774 [Harpegnathos saltator]XP_025152808.1 uncharacterized protein LOC105191774 [Harpegnathos saltator]
MIYEYEMTAEVDNIEKIMSIFKKFNPKLKYSFKRTYQNFYFDTNKQYEKEAVFMLRKFEDNTGQIIYYKDIYIEQMVDHSYVTLYLPTPLAEEFIDIFSQSNGHKRTISVTSYTYQRYSERVDLILHKIDCLGDFLTLQRNPTEEERNFIKEKEIIEMFKDILKELGIKLSRIVTKSFLGLIEEAERGI